MTLDSGLAGNQKPPAMYYDVHYPGLHEGLFVGKKPLRHMNAIRRERSQSNDLGIPRSGNASKRSNAKGR